MTHPLDNTGDRYREGGPHDDVAQNIVNERRAPAPDPNPAIPCDGCGERFGFQDYWEQRYVDPEDADPHEDDWLCDDCVRIEARREANHAVTEWVG